MFKRIKLIFDIARKVSHAYEEFDALERDSELRKKIQELVSPKKAHFQTEYA